MIEICERNGRRRPSKCNVSTTKAFDKGMNRLANAGGVSIAKGDITRLATQSDLDR